jgi:DNA-binding PadR family transcriptional regulator
MPIMRRKAGTVLPIERELLVAGVALKSRGIDEFHGFLIAHEMRDRNGAKDLIAYGNLYRILDRMRKAGWLKSEWEDPEIASEERRPRRRFYRVTAEGVGALERSQDTSKLAPALSKPLAGH